MRSLLVVEIVATLVVVSSGLKLTHRVQLDPAEITKGKAPQVPDEVLIAKYHEPSPLRVPEETVRSTPSSPLIFPTPLVREVTFTATPVFKIAPFPSCH